MADEDLRARLRDEPAAVQYDVARGLARHRALIEAGAAVPDWAHELPAARGSWLRRLAIWGGTLTVVTWLWARPTPEPAVQPTPVPHVAEQAAQVTRPAKEQVTATPTPRVELAPPAQEAAREEATAPTLEEPASAAARSRRVRARALSEGEDETVSRSARSARVVAPQQNLELAQLVEAERALASEPVRALRLAREGELSFRNGYFAQERRYIEVMALFALGRLGEAHAQAAAFVRDYPNAPYRRKIELELLRQPQH